MMLRTARASVPWETWGRSPFVLSLAFIKCLLHVRGKSNNQSYILRLLHSGTHSVIRFTGEDNLF